MKKSSNNPKRQLIRQKRQEKAKNRRKLYNQYLIEYYEGKHSVKFREWRNG